MALIRCSECGKEISDKASACVNCGCPVTTTLKPTYITVNFNAVLTGADNEKTFQNVYVNELGRNVGFYLDNDTVEGDIIKITLQENSAYEYIHFKAVSVTKTQKPAPVSYSSTSEGTKAIEILDRYKRNWIVRFFCEKGFVSIMCVIIFAVIEIAIQYNGDIEMISYIIASTAIIWVPCVLGRIFYPLHHAKKYIRKYCLENAIRNDSGYMNVAISAYNIYASNGMLKYIRSLNPAAAQRIEKQIADRKKKK